MRSKQLIISFLLGLVVSFTTIEAYAQKTQFESAEHMAAGDNIKLYFSAQDKGQVGYSFHLPSGLIMTYGDILAFADFYGVVGKPISQGESLDERKQLFLTGFNEFAEMSANHTEANNILAIMHNEKDSLEKGMQSGRSSEEVYATISGEINRQLNCVTGGGCGESSWWLKPGRYLDLTESDFDHFGDATWVAYQVGHELALEKALEAYKTQDIKKLELAYAMNAFACHFLSDRYAAGHIRTPRVELPASVTPAVVGSLLTNFMHNEDNNYGLHVHNKRGDRWIVYGDKSYFNRKNDENRFYLKLALQTSVDEIFYAYRYGTKSKNTIENLIPFADEEKDKARNDISPLFYWDANTKKLMRRVDVANVYDKHWTDNWWGFSTLVLLSEQRGIPAVSQNKLITAGLGEDALEKGLLTDQSVLNYFKTKKQK